MPQNDEIPQWKLALIAIICGVIIALIILHFFNRAAANAYGEWWGY